MFRELEIREFWKVEFTIPDTHREQLEYNLIDYSGVLVFSLYEDKIHSNKNADNQNWDLTVYGYGLKNQEELISALSRLAIQKNTPFPSIKFSPVASKDWYNFSEQNFPLIFAQRFVVHPKTLRPPRGRLALCINAGSAFGSGSHGSTRGCLLALDALARQTSVCRALDLGSGSGILAVAIAKAWCHTRKGNVQVLAVDNDPDAIACTTLAAKENIVVERVQACLSNGFEAKEVCSRGPYDLICANILAQPLKEMAPEIANNLLSSGTVILSGLLGEQEDEIEQVYTKVGLTKSDFFRLGEWSTLVFTR